MTTYNDDRWHYCHIDPEVPVRYHSTSMKAKTIILAVHVKDRPDLYPQPVLGRYLNTIGFWADGNPSPFKGNEVYAWRPFWNKPFIPPHIQF